MLFTEPAFLLVYLPVVIALYFAVPSAAKNYVLTLASLVFYAAGELAFLPWLVASTMVSYAFAIGLDRWRGERRGRFLLVAGVAIDLGLLVVFKYAGFFTGGRVSFALPLGISFFTFHKISYKVDVARGVSSVRRNPLDLFLYIALFPQLIAGPIVRYHEIADQLVARQQRLDELAAGIRRFIVGFGKKMLIANAAALGADRVFAIPGDQLSFGLAWLGIACYTVQIYVDFSAYSDMAIGLARMFGFRFPENFDYPYIATSITEFWRRWHMSLSRWFRDYLYIPLGGNRASSIRTYQNLAVVFLLCGLWHGAKWTFVAWGAFHGSLLIVERLGLGTLLARVPRILRHVYTMSFVMVGWVLFRAESIGDAAAFVRALVGLGPAEGAEHTVVRYFDRPVKLALVLGVVAAMPIIPTLRARLATRPVLELVVRSCAVPLLVVVLLLGAMQMAADSYNPFIYFRF